MRHIRVNISFTLDAIDADQMTLGGAPIALANHDHIAYRLKYPGFDDEDGAFLCTRAYTFVEDYFAPRLPSA